MLYTVLLDHLYQERTNKHPVFVFDQLAVREKTFLNSDAKEKQIHESLHSLFIPLCNFYFISFLSSFN